MAKLKGKFINRFACIAFAVVISVAAMLVNTFFVSSLAAGEDATIMVTLDRNSLNVGDSFNVKVTYQSNIESGYLTWELSYDSSIVSREGSSGTIIETYWFDDQSDNTTNITKTYSFKAKAVGKANFSISATSYKLTPDANGDSMSILKIGASATIADVGSSDATLKELTVDGGTLVPAFSPNTTSYKVTVPYAVTTLYIFPKTNDSRATHTIEGDEFLNVGTKTRTVVVIAQDGTVKKYVITITRQAKPTEAPTKTPSAPTATGSVSTTTSTQTSTSVVTPTPTIVPTVTEKPFDGTVMVDGEKYTIGEVTDKVKLPEGFEKTEVKYADEIYTGAVGISKNITLMYLESESYKGLFIYFERDNSFFKYIDISVKSGIYSLMRISDGDEKLDFNITKITVGEQLIDAYELSPDNKDFYIIRAMNWNGEINYYTYDTVEQTMQRYISEKISITPNEDSDKSEEKPVVKEHKNEKEEDSLDPKAEKTLIMLVIVACGICLIVAAFLVYFALKERKTCKIMTSSDDSDV